MKYTEQLVSEEGKIDVLGYFWRGIMFTQWRLGYGVLVGMLRKEREKDNF